MMLDGRRSVMMILAATAVVGLTAVTGSGGSLAETRAAAAPRAAALSGTWGTARVLPGAAALNQGGRAQVNSVSCSSPGNCSVGGWYTDSSRRTQAFIVSEVRGTWHAALEVPGTAALNKAFAQVSSVSCASAGNCSAGGWYTDSSDLVQPFVVSEVNGGWHNAVKVPGIATLNRGGDAVINSVSCASAGTCSAVGSYTDRSKRYQVFVVSKA
jgi:hypothetical protein